MSKHHDFNHGDLSVIDVTFRLMLIVTLACRNKNNANVTYDNNAVNNTNNYYKFSYHFTYFIF